MALKLIVVTPERKVVDTDADQVELPGQLGYLGILPGHAPLISLLTTGVLTYKRAAGEKSLALSAGFVEVANDAVSVLADLAEEPAEIDVPSAESDRARAEEELKTASRETLEEIRTRLELAQTRLAVARKG
ncbi:MAG TPA: ATP synthase F1 subunit epsilon [Thermoanaerobaculia bacterium]|nr:ATP synthase F1 subunit epsilon [Thermoanaerobaculia bacterium]